MTLRMRLAFGLGAMMFVMLLPLLASLRAMSELRLDAAALQNVEFQASGLLGRSRVSVQEIMQIRNYLALFPTQQTRAQFQLRLDSIRVLMDSVSRLTSGATGTRLLSIIALVETESDAAVKLASSGRGTMADSVIDRSIAPALDDMSRIMLVTEQSLQSRTRERVADVARKSSTARRDAMILLVAAALMAVLIGIWLTQSVSEPVDELDAGMRAVSEGDFGRPLGIEASRQDEFGRLAASYSSMATQLRELDRLKAEFISVASHELKTPINVITGYLQLLRDNVYGPLTDKQTEIVDTLSAQGKSLAKLVRGLLDVSRFEAGGGRIDPRNIAFPAFLGDLERTFRVLAIQRGVRFEVSRGSGLPSEVVWDPEQMNEVLGNLLTNAFKFTDKGGEVRLSVSTEGTGMRMIVSDSGAGIPAAQLPYVFEKFYTADNQTTGLKGTGLGLAIAKAIVASHGGTISVESSVGQGTTFSLLVPIRAANPVVPRTDGGLS